MGRKRKRRRVAVVVEDEAEDRVSRSRSPAQRRQAAVGALLESCRRNPGFRLNSGLVRFTAADQGVRAIAEAPIQPGALLAVIPRDCYLWCHHARLQTDPAAARHLTSVRQRWDELVSEGSRPALLDWADVELAVLLMAAKNTAAGNGRAPFAAGGFAPYLAALLPAPLHMPLEWDAAAVAAGAAGTQFGWAHGRLQAEAAMVWARCVGPLCTAAVGRAARGEEEQLFRYCLMIVMSHAFGEEEGEPGDSEGENADEGGGGGGDDRPGGPALVPVADLFNGMPAGQHSVEVSEVQVALHPGAAPEWATAVVAVREIAAGEELLNSYGELSSSVFLLKYGVLPAETVGRNPHEAAFLLPLRHLYERCGAAQTALLAELGYPPEVWAMERSSPVLLRLQDFLLRAEPEEPTEEGTVAQMPEALLQVLLILTWPSRGGDSHEAAGGEKRKKLTRSRLDKAVAKRAGLPGLHGLGMAVTKAFLIAADSQLAAYGQPPTAAELNLGDDDEDSSGVDAFVASQLARVRQSERLLIKTVKQLLT
jgi:hypothetical protein